MRLRTENFSSDRNIGLVVVIADIIRNVNIGKDGTCDFSRPAEHRMRRCGWPFAG